MLKTNEKLIAFMALGFGVILLAVLAVAVPLEEGSGALRILDAATGGLLLALGTAANALFRIREEGEKSVTIDNAPSNPVPTTDNPQPLGEGELPPEQRI